MTILLSPGQGSQSAGLLGPWLALDGARGTLDRWSEQCDLDLVGLGTTAPDEVVRRTDVAQPLLTAVALLSGRAVLDGAVPTATCGHSVGELSALALAGVLTDDEAVVLAAGRGRAMAEAAAQRPTGMAAVLGGGPLDLTGTDLELATVNVAGQVVVGGPLDALDAWQPPAGARVRRLEVAGAFHTSAMTPAVQAFSSLVADLSPRDAQCDVVANADGAVLRDGQELLQRLVAQLTSPVRFDLCLESLRGERAVELAPAGVLTPLVRRGRPDLPVSSVRTPADVLVAA